MRKHNLGTVRKQVRGRVKKRDEGAFFYVLIGEIPKGFHQEPKKAMKELFFMSRIGENA